MIWEGGIEEVLARADTPRSALHILVSQVGGRGERDLHLGTGVESESKDYSNGVHLRPRQSGYISVSDSTDEKRLTFHGRSIILNNGFAILAIQVIATIPCSLFGPTCSPCPLSSPSFPSTGTTGPLSSPTAFNYIHSQPPSVFLLPSLPQVPKLTFLHLLTAAHNTPELIPANKSKKLAETTTPTVLPIHCTPFIPSQLLLDPMIAIVTPTTIEL